RDVAALSHELRRQAHLRLAGDELCERLAYRGGAGDKLALLRHQRGVPLVERNECIELACIESLDEQPVDIPGRACGHGPSCSKGSRSADPAPGTVKSLSAHSA